MSEIKNETAAGAELVKETASAAETPSKPSPRERLKEITDSIERGIQELFNSDRYRQYLATMSRFHRYSVNNQMLIYMQRPDASLVAGYSKWQTQFSRHVNKGEKGITIIAPTPYKTKVEEVKRDPDTKLPLRGPDGEMLKEEVEVVIPRYRPVTVFDVSQTDGKPLPTLVQNLTAAVQNYDVMMEALRRSSPVPISIEPIHDGSDGFYSHASRSITIKEGMSESQTVSTTIHEIAHAKLHDVSYPVCSCGTGAAPGDRPACFHGVDLHLAVEHCSIVLHLYGGADVHHQFHSERAYLPSAGTSAQSDRAACTGRSSSQRPRLCSHQDL